MTHPVARLKTAPLKDLPAPLPVGERVIWQGRPSVKALAMRAFHVRAVALYFAALFAYRLWSNAAAGMATPDALVSAGWLLVPAVASVAVLTTLAWLFARAATYTITSKRVILQFGVALPMALNIPLDKIAGASLKTYGDGSGDIPLALADNKGAWLLLWPHVRPWRLRAAQPMLRGIPDAAAVAARLAELLGGKPTPAALAVMPSAAQRPARQAASAAAAA